MSKWLEAASEIRTVMDEAGAMLTDEQAATVPSLYKQWDGNGKFPVGERRVYGGVLYKCLQAHFGQEEWNPADAPSLWAKVLTSDAGDVLPWEQPESTNPYMTGDKVTHNGSTWISVVDSNVWEPGVYGWNEVTEQ